MNVMIPDFTMYYLMEPVVLCSCFVFHTNRHSGKGNRNEYKRKDIRTPTRGRERERVETNGAQGLSNSTLVQISFLEQWA